MLFAVKLSMTSGPSVSRDYYCTTCREYWNIDAALAVHLFTPWHGVCVFTRVYTHTSSSDPKVAYTNFSLPIHALEQSEVRVRDLRVRTTRVSVYPGKDTY